MKQHVKHNLAVTLRGTTARGEARSQGGADWLTEASFINQSDSVNPI